MTDTLAPPEHSLSAADAEWLEAEAEQKRAAAAGQRGIWAAQQLAEAAGIDALVAALRDPERRGMPTLHRGRGGELAPRPDGDMPGRHRELATAVSQAPALLAAEASLDRLNLARSAGSLTLAVETAQDARAETATEKMLAHQMATAHALAMQLAAKAGDFAAGIQSWDSQARQQVQSIEAARMTAASARMMETFQRAALTLDRLRNGARQTVVVQHVAVAEGGQAVVAGTVAPGSRRK
jgi:hypothetical protein